jgi:hypothetical protein
MKMVEMCMFDDRFNSILLISWILTFSLVGLWGDSSHTIEWTSTKEEIHQSNVGLWETSSHQIISSGPPPRKKSTNLL